MRFSILALGVMAAVLPAGCHAGMGHLAHPLTQDLANNDPDAQVEFWHALPERKAVSNDEAFHAMLLFADGQDNAADYAGRVETLKKRGMLARDFSGAAADSVRRGTVAVALAKVLSIRGGLTMHLFGSSPRYAVRELQHAGLFPPSSPQQTFSGAEFLGIIGRAEDYQRAQGQDALAPEPQPTTSTGGGV